MTIDLFTIWNLMQVVAFGVWLWLTPTNIPPPKPPEIDPISISMGAGIDGVRELVEEYTAQAPQPQPPIMSQRRESP